jgi:plasmid stability protein
MGQNLMRNINDEALEILKAGAKARGQSLEAAIRELIERKSKQNREAIIASFQEIRKLTPGVLPPLTADEYRKGLE